MEVTRLSQLFLVCLVVLSVGSLRRWSFTERWEKLGPMFDVPYVLCCIFSSATKEAARIKTSTILVWSSPWMLRVSGGFGHAD